MHGRFIPLPKGKKLQTWKKNSFLTVFLKISRQIWTKKKNREGGGSTSAVDLLPPLNVNTPLICMHKIVSYLQIIMNKQRQNFQQLNAMHVADTRNVLFISTHRYKRGLSSHQTECHYIIF